MGALAEASGEGARLMSAQENPIVVLTVPFGSAHTRTAEALTKAWNQRERATLLQTVPLNEYLPRRVVNTLTFSYLSLIRHAPALFRYVYRRGREPGVSDRLLNTAVRLSRPSGRKLRSLFDSQPGMWVSTHPLTSVLARAADSEGSSALAILITDHHFHAFWSFPDATDYFVGRPAMRDALLRRRIPRRSIQLTGIPIDPAFSVRTPRQAAERLVGLPEADFRVLLMGGGLGIGPIEELTRRIRSLDVPPQVVVVAGRNKKLRARLSGIGKGVISLGYVDTIPLLMAASDLCLTKPGGLTIAEAAAMGVPTLLFDPLPGHEEANIETLVREGAAFRIGKVERAPGLVSELKKRPSLLRRMGRKMSRFGRPRAAFDMADLLEAMWKKRYQNLPA